MKRDIGLRGASRRDFIKGVLTASAALGLGPLRALEVLDGMGGSALADDGCVQTQRMVHLVAGFGGLSWFTLVWPVPQSITGYQSSFAYDDPTLALQQPGLMDGRQLYVRKMMSTGKALWQDYGAAKQVSAMVCGVAGNHENVPAKVGNTNTIRDGVGGQVGVNAGASALQVGLNTLVPSIGIQYMGENMPYGFANGAPTPASVPGATQMVSLFSSSASRIANRLANPNNQQLFNQYYKAFLSLAKTASKATYQNAYTNSKVAISLLTENLGAQLAPDPNKINAWVGAAAVDETVVAMAQALLVTANAFKLGLTSQVSIPVFLDDPHPAFGDVGRVARIAEGTCGVLQGFLDELKGVNEPQCSSRALSDNVVLMVSGDLPKNPFIRANWPDNTPGNGNWIYVMSQGFIRPGWHGAIAPPAPGTMTFQNPSTGKLDTTVPEDVVTSGSLGSVLFAVTRGDSRAVRNQFTGDISAITNVSLTG